MDMLKQVNGYALTNTNSLLVTDHEQSPPMADIKHPQGQPPQYAPPPGPPPGTSLPSGVAPPPGAPPRTRKLSSQFTTRNHTNQVIKAADVRARDEVRFDFS